MAEKLKAGVIGCGGAAQIDHIPLGIRKSNWWAWRIRILKRQNFAPRNGAAIPTEMLEKEKPDLVSVCSPVALHAEHTVAVAEQHCHLLCEKPMAPTLEECDRMISAANNNGVKLGMAFHKRHNVGLAEVRRKIKAGAIGEPIYLRTHRTMFAGRSKGFRGQLSSGGGCFQDHGSHYIDQYRWWIGEIATVQGHLLLQWPEEMEVEDQGTALLQFKDGPQGMIEASWVGPSYQYGQIEETWVYGTEGALTITVPPWTHYQPPDLKLWRRQTKEWVTVPLASDMLHFEHYHYKRQMDDFVRAVLEDNQPAATGEDGRKAMEVVLALYLSHHTKKTITLPLDETPPIKEIFIQLREESRKRAAK